MTAVERKIRTVHELGEIAASLRELGKRVVLCHGVFDLLHIGHIRYLTQAKEHGDVLMVSITPDRFVDKGPDRPAFTESLRAEALASLGETDYIAINEWPTAEETLRIIRPAVYAKGDEFKDIASDPAGKIGPEAEVVREIGAELVFTSDIVFSSSNLINKYIANYGDEMDEYLRMFRKRYALSALREKLEAMRGLKVLVVGDTILDEYQITSALGKSSKDPILALKYQSHDVYAGGALAVANHVAGFAGEVGLLTILGDMQRQEEFIRKRLRANVTPHFFTRPNAPTTLKRRFIDDATLNKVLEIYVMNDEPLSAELDAALCAKFRELVGGYDLVIVADFGHGMVSSVMVEQLVEHAPFLAVNTQANAGNRGFNLIGRYPRADFFAVAEHELRLETRDQVSEVRPLLVDVGNRMKVQAALVTQGSRGCSLWTPEREFVRVPSFSTTVVDRVGAGDALFSVASLACFMGLHEELVAFFGNVAGSLAVRILGNDKFVDREAMKKYITAILK